MPARTDLIDDSNLQQERTRPKPKRGKNALLWTVQVLVAAIFLFAGIMKLITPVAVLAAQSHLPGMFLRFIAVAEVLGAFGLILPGLLRIAPVLTPITAAGLAIIVAGATEETLRTPMPAVAVLPFVVCLLCVWVAYARWRIIPHRGR